MQRIKESIGFQKKNNECNERMARGRVLVVVVVVVVVVDSNVKYCACREWVWGWKGRCGGERKVLGVEKRVLEVVWGAYTPLSISAL